MSEDLISHKLDTISEDVGEIKADLRELKNGAPLYRITQLENRWSAVAKWVFGWLSGVSVALIGVVAAVLIRT